MARALHKEQAQTHQHQQTAKDAVLPAHRLLAAADHHHRLGASLDLARGLLPEVLDDDLGLLLELVRVERETMDSLRRADGVLGRRSARAPRQALCVTGWR